MVATLSDHEFPSHHPIDRDGRASRAAAEGKFALGAGDTLLAAEKYAEAAAILEREAATARKSPEKNLLRFLAASHYFYGGHYPKALKLTRQVEARFLPDRVRPLFEPFFHDAKYRAGRRYAQATRDQLGALWRQNEYRRIIQLLKLHPYIVGRSELAYMRGVLLHQLGDYKTAALFFNQSGQFGSVPPPVLMGAACMLFLVEGREGLSVAVEVARTVAKLFPHVGTEMAASLVFYRAILAASDDAAPGLFEEQMAHLEVAKQLFAASPDVLRRDPDFKNYMVICLAAGAYTALQLRDVSTSRSFLDSAQAIGSNAQPLTKLLTDIELSIRNRSHEAPGDKFEWLSEVGRRFEKQSHDFVTALFSTPA